MTALSRRALLAGSAAAAFAGDPARAAVPAAGRQAAGVYRAKVGGYELTALYDGTWFRKIDETFVRNVPFAQVQSAIADSFLPPDIVPTSFSPLLVNTGS